MGRPEIIFDDKQLRNILKLKPRLKDVANFFECSEDTIERRIREKYNCTFAEFRDQNAIHTRFDLIKKAIEKAERGDNVMLIFCLKNLCGWRDKYDEGSTFDDEASKRDEVKPTRENIAALYAAAKTGTNS